MKRFYPLNELFPKALSLRNTILAGIILFVMLFVISPAAERYIMQWSGWLGVFDTHWTSDPIGIYNQIDSYGEKGREAYVFILFTVDLFLIVLYCFFLSSVLQLLATCLNDSYHAILLRMPFVIGVLDFSGNTLLAFGLYQYPTKYPTLMLLSSGLDITKYIFFYFLLIWIFGRLLLWKIQKP